VNRALYVCLGVIANYGATCCFARQQVPGKMASPSTTEMASGLIRMYDTVEDAEALPATSFRDSVMSAQCYSAGRINAQIFIVSSLPRCLACSTAAGS